MTTITIENSDLKKKKFETTTDLLDFLLTHYSDETVLVKTKLEDLNAKELKAWEQHKKDGYSDFVDLK